MKTNKLFLYRFINYEIYFKDKVISLTKRAYNIFKK